MGVLDWCWLAGVAVVIAKVVQLGRDNDDLKKRVATLELERSEPFPSDDSEELLAIRNAKKLAKEMGDKFNFAQAYRAVKRVRDERKRREAAGGDGGNSQQTA